MDFHVLGFWRYTVWIKVLLPQILTELCRGFTKGNNEILHWKRELLIRNPQCVGVFGNMYIVLWLRFFLPWLRFFRAFFLSCKANARVKLAKTGHGPHSSRLVVICVILLLFVLFYVLFVTRWRSWLRHCATSRRVAVSIPDDITGIFHWHNPSGRAMALGLTQLLTEMSTRNISWG
jgi:hypothetical protein